MRKSYALTFIKSASVLSFLLVFLYACNREEVNKPASKPEPISVQDGVLKFDSEETFNSTLKKLNELHDRKALDKWENQWNGFKSVRTAFNELTEEDQLYISAKNSVINTKYASFMSLVGQGEEREAVRIVVGDALATLVSKEGLVYVGEQAVHYAYEKQTTIVNLDKYSKSQLLELAASPSPFSKDVTIEKIERRIIKTSERKISDPNGRSPACVHNYWHGNATCCAKRQVGEIIGQGSTSAGGTFNAVGVATKHQRKISGIWYLDQAPQLRVDYSKVTLDQNGQRYEFILADLYRNDDGNMEVAFDLSTASQKLDAFTIYQWDSIHSATCDDYVDRDCYVSWW